MNIQPDLSVCCVSEGVTNNLFAFLQSIDGAAGMAQVQKIIILPDTENRIHSLTKALEHDYPDAIIYESGGRENRTAALNRALLFATGRYISCWNEDVILNEGCLRNLLYFMDDTPDAGISGPRFTDASGRTRPTAWPFFTTPALFRLFLGLGVSSRSPNYIFLEQTTNNTPREVDWLSASGIIIRREVLEENGLFNPRLPRNFAVMDLCERVKKTGWHSWYCPGAGAARTKFDPPCAPVSDALRLILCRLFRLKPRKH